MPRLHCGAAIRHSAQAYDEASQLMAGVPSRALARYDRPSCRAMIAMTVLTPHGPRDAVCHMVLKAAHSTLMGDLGLNFWRGPGKDNARPFFRNSTVRWDATHAVHNRLLVNNQTSCRPPESLLPEPALGAGASRAALHFAVVRDPLGHMLAGIEEVEDYYARNLRLQRKDWLARFQRDYDAGSVWRRMFRDRSGVQPGTDASFAKRAEAMIGDMLAGRGSHMYLNFITHAVPQSLGLGFVGGDALPPAAAANGTAALGLDYLASMEALDAEYATVEWLLGGTAPLTGKAQLANPSGKRRKAKGITKQGFLAAASEDTRRALCLVMQREYACLAGLSVAYTMPPELASAC